MPSYMDFFHVDKQRISIYESLPKRHEIYKSCRVSLQAIDTMEEILSSTDLNCVYSLMFTCLVGSVPP